MDALSSVFGAITGLESDATLVLGLIHTQSKETIRFLEKGARLAIGLAELASPRLIYLSDALRFLLRAGQNEAQLWETQW